MYSGLCVFLLFLWHFNQSWIFSTDFLSSSQISNLITWEPSCWQTDRHDGANSRFSQCWESAKKENLFRQSPAMWCLYVVSFARCAPGCSASAHIAQRSRSDVTTATRATLSRPQLLLLQPAKPGTYTAIPWNDLHFIRYGISVYRRATSFKIVTFSSCFLGSCSSLKQTFSNRKSSVIL